MKCQVCKGEMEKGILAADGQRWVKPEGVRKLFFNLGTAGIVGEMVYAYKCPTCSEIKLVAIAK